MPISLIKIDKKTGEIDRGRFFNHFICKYLRNQDFEKLENIRRKDFKALCDRIEEKVKGINPLFPSVAAEVEKEADFIYCRILNERLLDCKVERSNMLNNERIEASDIQKTDVNSIENEDSRTFGDEWPSKQMTEACGLRKFLLQNIENENIEKMIEVEIIARMVHPSSELETSRWLGRRKFAVRNA